MSGGRVMRQLLLAAGVVCAGGLVAQCVSAQSQTIMPGQAVGTSYRFNSVGTTFPQAGKKLGQPINIPPDSALMRRADPNNPLAAFRGSALDPSNVIAPVAGLGNGLENFFDKVKSAVGLSVQTPPARPNNVTPGIFRRNRERAKQMLWRRD
jgi:hypothetical protein